MAEWTRQENGLWIPAGTPRDNAAGSRSRDGLAVWVQAIATVMALAIAVWSGWIALRLTTSQIDANQSQLTANQVTQNSLKTRYAAKISFFTKNVASQR